MPIHVIDMGLVGPLIGIGLSVGRIQAAAGRGGPPGTFNGLIDTGASTTAISNRVRKSLQLRQLSRIPVWRPGGIRATASSFDIRLKFEGHLAPFPWFDLEVVETNPATPGVDLLIGQDLLLQVTMVYNGPLAKLVVMY
jgi:hypothetical protein